MNLDFLDVLSQPKQNRREQLGTAGTAGTACIDTHIGISEFGSVIENSGNKTSPIPLFAPVVVPKRSQSGPTLLK